jgi:hypothetical protein
MKTKSETYRENAANVSQLATEAEDEPSRKQYMMIAAAWLDLAEEQDGLNRRAPAKDVSGNSTANR